MKKGLHLTVLLLLVFTATFAQTVPKGMNYQAVARNLSGNVISNQEISLKISLLTNGTTATVYYTEVHTVTTNQLGLFTLVIGEGKTEKGNFAAVPWSTEDIWMQVSIKDKGNSSFAVINNSRLLAVPYAFHAGTASQLVGQAVSGAQLLNTSSTASNTGVPSATWSTKGNSNTDPSTDHLGTTDAADLVIITNNLERLRVLANGDVDLKNKLTVGNDLVVKQNVRLNTDGGTTDIKGAATLQNTLTVGGATALNNKVDISGVTTSTNNTQSTAPNNGALVVTGGAGIGGNLNVGGAVNFGGASAFGGQLHITDVTQSTSTTTGALIVDGGTGVAKNLTVGGTASVTNNTASTNPTSGAFVVSGGAGVGGDLNVRGIGNFANVGVSNNVGAKGLNIVNDTSSYLATFQNNNDGNGDGIRIKLGRAKSAYTVPSTADLTSSELTEANKFKDLIRCDYSGNRLTLLGQIIADDAVETAKVVAGIAISAGNYIVSAINTGLSLPINVPSLDVPAIEFPKLAVPDIVIHTPDPLPNITLPGFTVTDAFELTPSLHLLDAMTVMPRLPNITVPGIPAIDITNLAFWGLDFNLCLTDGAGTSPLNNNNEFIRFADKNDNKVGSIKGESVSDWAANYLNPSFLSKLRGAFLSSKMDKFHAQYHFKTEITTALASYAKIGVEYSSGNGDYAEWLERSDKAEAIEPGDIVAVKGGKITKDLRGAEQVMVVSHNPIMLGNTPAEGKDHQGNNIAFIGQVPVKVMGPVASGDYIVGQMNIPGYGVAKHPNAMSVDDYKLAVGRSWESDESGGIKMINTVVGVHNNTFLNMVKELKDKEERTDARLKAIEAKLNMKTPVAKHRDLPAKKPLTHKKERQNAVAANF